MTKKFDELNEDARIVADLTEYFDWTSADVEEGNVYQYSSTKTDKRKIGMKP